MAKKSSKAEQNKMLRRRKFLDAAAELFAVNGFEATSMREIAAHMGKTPGSIYHHFKSKDELLIAINEEAVEQARESLAKSTQQSSDPWKRLEQACKIHLRSLLEGNYSSVVLQSWPTKNPKIRSKLIKIRDRHETLFKKLIEDLPIESEEDRKYLRMTLFGALNYVQLWYKPHRDSADEIAKQILFLLRSDLLQQRA